MAAMQTQRIVAAILIEGGRVLLVRRAEARRWYPNMWDLPGGHVETGESEGQAVVRELREELGIDVSAPTGEPLKRLYDRDVSKGFMVDLSVWLVPSWTGVVRNTSPAEHRDLRWVSPGELSGMELAHPEYVRVVGSVVNGS
jgi:8-oxo-dGTP diphosphatase